MTNEYVGDLEISIIYGGEWICRAEAKNVEGRLLSVKCDMIFADMVKNLDVIKKKIMTGEWKPKGVVKFESKFKEKPDTSKK